MLDVAFGVVVEYHSRVEQAVGVEELFHGLHHGIGVVAPLVAHEGSHVTARAVLGLQRAVVFVHHQGLHVVHQALVAAHLGVGVERLVDDEVVVALQRVSVDAGVVVAVARYQLLQVGSGVGQVLDVEGHVLDEAGGAQLARAAHGGEDA